MLWTALAVAAAILTSSTIPYLFPPSQVNIGPSYDLAFNNSLSFFLYLPLMVLAAALAAPSIPPAEPIPTRWSVSWGRRSLIVLAIVVAAHLVVFTSIYVARGRFVFADAIYFQFMLYRMHLGEVPYVDFGFYYGPSMLYPAHVLAEILGLDAGYGIAFVVTYLLGVVLLFLLVHRLLRRRADLWAVVIAVGLFTPLATLNVTFFRALLPAFSFVVMQDAARVPSFRSLLGAVTLLAFAILYSFEVALLAIGAGTLIVLVGAFLWCRPTGAAVGGRRITLRAATILALAIAVAIAVLILIDDSGRALAAYPRTAIAYASGAHNYPVYPSLPFLFLTACTVIAGAVAFHEAARYLRHATRTFLLAGLGVLALASERGAFATAEAGHIFEFGLPALLVALNGIARSGSRLMQGIALFCFLLGWAFPWQYYQVRQLAPAVLRSPVSQASGSAAASAGIADRASTEASMDELVRMVGNDKPYLMPGLEYYSLTIYRRYSLRPATYEWDLATAKTPAGITRMIDDVRSTGAIIIMPMADLNRPRLVAGEGRSFDLLVGAVTPDWPLSIAGAISQAHLFAPFYSFARSEYRVLARSGSLVALGPR